MKKFGIEVGSGFGRPLEECVASIRNAGFDACFTGWREDTPLCKWAEIIARAGLEYQSVHAPYGKVNTLWEEGEEGERQLAILMRCLADCNDAGVPIMVVHPIIGMDRHSPCALGVERFSRLADAATGTKVRLAFENVEGLEYLDAVMSALDTPSVGFCWDTGHEMCYNYSTDVPARYPGRLICTHINDNMGMTDPAVVTWVDDSHLIPGDGVGNWQSVADRLDREGYAGILTFELTRNNKPGRNTHDRYLNMSFDSFLALAYERALRLSALRRM